MVRYQVENTSASRVDTLNMSDDSWIQSRNDLQRKP